MRKTFAISIFLALSSSAINARGETVLETFDRPPQESGWIREGEDAEFAYQPEGWLRARNHISNTKQHFLLPLGGNYHEGQEFWFEFDWRPEAVYEWPRAHIGVMRREAEGNADLVGVSFQIRRNAQGDEGQRGIGFASDGTRTAFSTPPFPRRVNERLDARTAVHFWQNDAGEGWMNIVITDLAGGATLATATGRVLAAGKSLTFDSIGIASTVSDSRSPHLFDRMRFDNLYFSTDMPADEWFAARRETRPAPSWVEDVTPPAPNPPTWAEPPAALRATQVTMRAAEATDDSYRVEYLFENVTVPGRQSGWQSGPVWTDKNLSPNTEYTYRVKARDLSPNRNETEWSAPASTVTPAETDVSPPRPNPMVWEAEPLLAGANRVTMTAVAAGDAEGNEPVEYYFANLTDRTRDSGWQQERIFVDAGLAFDTDYAYAVKARDASANRNETDFSPAVSIRTRAEPARAAFLRHEGLWQGDVFPSPISYEIYYRQPESGREPLPTIVYFRNTGMPRVGTEPDGPILSDLINDGYLVIVLDFAAVADAVSPALERELLGFHQSLPTSRPNSVLAGSGFLADPGTIYFLPAGYRIERNLVYWNVRDHGWEGTMQRILDTYNGHVVERFGVAPVTDPAEIRGPNGEEIDYNLYLDLIYPSRPEGPVPLLIDSSTNLPRMHSFRPDTERMIYPISFTANGYAWAVMDHCWNPLARREHYSYWPQYSLDAWNGLASSTAAIRFFRAHAEQFNLASDSIGIMGHSKGAYAATRLADPDHVNQSEHSRFPGFPQTTPQPQPWSGFSSEVAATYQSMGNGTRRLQYVTERNVPTIIACGRHDQYNHWIVFPELVERYVRHDLHHLALWMTELGHDYPRGFDELYGADRFALLRTFFDAHLRPRSDHPPAVLYILPRDGAEGVPPTKARHLPAARYLPDHTLDLLEATGPWAVQFAPAVDPDSINGGGIAVRRISDGKPLPGTWRAARQNSFFLFLPDEEALSNTDYEIVVTTRVRDLQGNALREERSSRFRTAQASAGR